jgi:hypothetical protein
MQSAYRWPLPEKVLDENVKHNFISDSDFGNNWTLSPFDKALL